MLQQPSRKKPVNGRSEQSASSPPRTLRAFSLIATSAAWSFAVARDIAARQAQLEGRLRRRSPWDQPARPQRQPGGEKALVREVCQRIEAGYWYWQTVDPHHGRRAAPGGVRVPQSAGPKLVHGLVELRSNSQAMDDFVLEWLARWMPSQQAWTKVPYAFMDLCGYAALLP